MSKMTSIFAASSMSSSRLSSHAICWMELKSPLRNRINIDSIFAMGQCFNWKKVGDETRIWTAVIDNVPLAMKSLPGSGTTYYANLQSFSHPDRLDDDSLRLLVEDYFQLDQNMDSLITDWASRCGRMKIVGSHVAEGLRILRQDPWECLCSFICSSNNNIKRISLILERLRFRYGKYVCTLRRSRPTAFDSKDEKTANSDEHLRLDSSGWEVVYTHSMATSDVNASVVLNMIKSPPPKGNRKKRVLIVDEMRPTEDDEGEEEEEEVTSISSSEYHMYSFPSIEALATAEEKELRDLGVGYRAQFLIRSAEFVLSRGGSKWFDELRVLGMKKGYYSTVTATSGGATCQGTQGQVIKAEESTTKSNSLDTDCESIDNKLKQNRVNVQEQLMQLHGVGRKVADCVALFSLDQAGSVPVDTHVWDITVRDYAPWLKDRKSLTPSVYEEVGDIFRSRFGARAGWAHSLLFAAELPSFRRLLPEAERAEMLQFAQLRREEAKTKKATKKISKEDSETGAQKA